MHNLQKTVKHYEMMPETYEQIVRYLVQQPYKDVDKLIQLVAKGSQAIFYDTTPETNLATAPETNPEANIDNNLEGA